MDDRTKQELTRRLLASRDVFEKSFGEMSMLVHINAKEHGWWDSGERNFGEQIALMHSELSEALEAYRNGIEYSDHVETMLAIEEELADVIIRCMDTSHKNGYSLGKAIVDKMLFNVNREYKHGGKKI